MLNTKRWSTSWGGRELIIETGRYALLTDASCTVQYGDTVILATVAKSDSIREGMDYFPLTVSFEEKLYAAGKIKGSRFMKREGRPSDEAILTGRLIDRAIRPLFDDSIRQEVQVILTPLSVDGENDASITALIAASAALAISTIPWKGPIGAVRVGQTETGEFILNATLAELKAGALDLVVAGTPEKLVMVESGAKEIPEQKMIDAMMWGAEQTKPVIDLITRMQQELVIVKKAPESVVSEEQAQANMAVRAFVSSVADSMIFNSAKISRTERNTMVADIKTAAKEKLLADGMDEALVSKALGQIKLYVSEEVSKRILEKKQRLDGRSMTDIRELVIDVDLLPRVHGSAMFMRGDTQALSIVTLGAPGDVQTLDTMEEEGTKRYMHHYNDAPYTYGEAGMMRGPGRRAIGHGALAERAIEPVLPDEETFPYAIRVVSEVLGSNGSSSMASTCGSSLSLMAAGVPLRTAVAGIAMGLATNSSGQWEVLTDLQDVEDGPGGMDFKIAGTMQGITAMQMDTKTEGLSWDIVKKTIIQSYEARVRILKSMTDVIAEPRADLSPYAPRIETIRIDPEKIGDVIGPGGKTIKKIIEETGVNIDIEQDGRVMITSNDAEAMKKAREWVELLTKEVQAGEVYEGKVVRLEDFGAFVNLIPGKDGLVHVSEVAWARTNKPSDVLKMGDTVKVVVKEIDNLGRVNLSIKALLPKPENMPEQSFSPRPPRSNTGGGGSHSPRPYQDRGGAASGGGDAAPKKRGFFRRDS